MPFIPLNKRQHPDFAQKGRKPVGPVELEKPQIFHTLLRNSTRDDVSGLTPAFGGDSSITAPEGLRIRGGSATTADGYVDYSVGNILSSRPYCVYVRVKFKSNEATTSGGDVICEKPYTSAAEPYYVFQIKRQRTTSTGSIGFQYTVGGTRYSFTVGDTGDLVDGDTADIILGVSDGYQYGMFLKHDGTFKDANTSNSGAPTDYNTVIRLGASQVLPALGSLDKNIEYARVFDYVPPSVAKTILRDPYQILKPAVDLHAFWASGAASFTLTANSGSYSVTGSSANLEHNKVISATSGSYSLTGSAASLEKGYLISAASGSYSLSGTSANLEHHRTLSASSGNYSVSGSAVTLTVTSPSSFTLVAESGSYSLSGTSTNLEHHRIMSATSGSYSLSGSSAGLYHGYTVAAASGSYSLSGSSASLVKTNVLSAASGSYSLTGSSASLIVGELQTEDCFTFLHSAIVDAVFYNAPINSNNEYVVSFIDENGLYGDSVIEDYLGVYDDTYLNSPIDPNGLFLESELCH